MTYSLVVTAHAEGSGSKTSSAVNTSGANLLVMGAAFHSFGGQTASDSKGNTYTNLTLADNGAQIACRIAYVESPTVGSGHTFTSDNSIENFFGVGAFSGGTASSFDQQNGGTNTSSVTSQVIPSITPTQANEVCFALLGLATNGTGLTCDSSYNQITAVDSQPFDNNAAYFGYLIQTTAGATSPTVSWTTATANKVYRAASFKAAAEAAATASTFLMMGV